MGYNFRAVERDQLYLLPLSVRDWLPGDDLAWLVLDAVGEMDLGSIYARYRTDGWGAPAYEPAMMTALLLYAYASGERSSRRIEALCGRDAGYKVVTANQVPDHATIARFRADHETALADLFTEVLRLCAAAGLGKVGLVALDGTKLAANASIDANREAAALDAEIRAILAEAAAVDAAEDERYGPDRRGDELPPELADRRSRLTRLREARRQLAEADAARKQAWQADEATRSRAEAATGQRLPGRRPTPEANHRRSWAQRNTTDPDSRKLPSRQGWIVGYNGQLAVAEDGLILAAELTQQPADVTQLRPMVERTEANLRAARVSGRIGTLLADAGYWSEANLAAVEPGRRTRFLIAPTAGRSRTPGSRRPPTPRRDRMRRLLAHPVNQARYQRRGAIVEPVFGQLKEVRAVRRFQRRGFEACASEWRLLALTHNLLKLWRATRSTPSGPAHGPSPRPRPYRRRRSS